MITSNKLYCEKQSSKILERGVATNIYCISSQNIVVGYKLRPPEENQKALKPVVV